MIIKLISNFRIFSIWFKTFLREVANNIISVIFILSVYLALWHFPQTVDLLLILNQADAFIFEVPLYFGALSIAAFLIWNVPKYFYYHNYKDITFYNFIGFIPNQHYLVQNKKESIRYSYLVKIHMRKTVPRILAILLLAISALSILNAMELFGLDNMYTYYLNPSNTLLLVILFLLLVSEPIIYENMGRLFLKLPKSEFIIPILSVALFLFIISLGTLNTQAEKDLGKLFLSGCALTVLFFTLCFNSYTFLKTFPKKLFYGGILTSGFLVILLILVLNFFPNLATGINPLSILVFSLLSLFMICFLLILIGKKIKLPVLTLVFILCIFSSRFFTNSSDHYYLDLVNTTVHRPSMDTYIYNWLQSRKDLIENGTKKFPVLLVSAEGGGSRAGLWAFLVHSYLYEKSQGAYFRNNLLSLTGASGGGVGNGMFFSAAEFAETKSFVQDFKVKPDTNYPNIKYKASAIYKENYLSIALLSLLGRDFLKEVSGLFHFKNRGKLLENQWIDLHSQQFKENSKEIKEGLLNKEFLSFYKNIKLGDTLKPKPWIPPLLFINTTHTQTGNYNIISPVTYNHLKPLAGLNDFLNTLQSNDSKKSISLATAMRINASFPFITPVGEIKKSQNNDQSITDQYADAGYYDNIGGIVSKGVEEVFFKVLRDSFPQLVSNIEIKHVLIANEEKRKIAKTETQYAAPLATLGNVRYGHTQEIMDKLGLKYAIRLKQTAIVPNVPTLTLKPNAKKPEAIKPVLPLGRYLSTIAIRSMEARLKVISKELDSILGYE